MSEEWNDLVKSMPILLKQLTSQPLRPWNDQGILPQKGLYVFYEGGKPMYVGRTNSMSRRLQQHGNPSSGHNSATFAFNIAKRQATRRGMNVQMSRSQLAVDPAFSKLYLKAKARVAKMPVRVIELSDPIVQTLFEVYAAMRLDTREYNDFDTH
ncbi:MAG: GIY-YIG nuclease family protein [Dehalococcoidia bacterium]